MLCIVYKVNVAVQITMTDENSSKLANTYISVFLLAEN